MKHHAVIVRPTHGAAAPCALAAGMLLLGGTLDAMAQAAPPVVTATQQPGTAPVEDPDEPDTDYVEPVVKAPVRIQATDFLTPDLPDGWNRHTTYEGSRLSAIFSVVSLVDYNAFSQDADSERQVGEQADQWDLRTLRLMVRGKLKFAHPVSYLISLEVKGQDHVQDDESNIGLTDLEISTPVWKLGTLKYGKIKEPFVYEMVGDAANLQQQERALNPFFVSRGIGFRLTNRFARDSLTWSVGWFNDWWVKNQAFEESGNDFAARLTAVPHWSDGGANYLHLGVSGRYTGADAGSLRLRGRPESNITDYYVDTDQLEGNHANALGLESAWGRGPFFVSSDYARAWLDAPASGDPEFWGTFVSASYVLTGEHRPYDKKVAYARRILPEQKGGAWELVGRYSHVDITDGLVDGGTFDRRTIGINWWATRRWKFGVDYGYITLDRGGVTGVTHALHTRVQWIY